VSQKNSANSLHSSGLRRDLSILEVLASAESWANGGMGVNKIAEAAQRDKAQVSRSLKTLAASGLVDRDPLTQKYRLGHRLYQLATRTTESHLGLIAENYLREAVAQVGEASHLSTLRGGQVLVISSELSGTAEYRSDRESNYLGGEVFPASLSAAGRVFLAYMTPEAYESWVYEFGQGDPNLEGFEGEAESIREFGYATQVRGLSETSAEVSAPIRDAANQVVAAISIAGSVDRIGAQLDQIGSILSSISIEMSLELGAPIFGPA
jgi:DNA-binding IclR family transcriptional regulator